MKFSLVLIAFLFAFPVFSQDTTVIYYSKDNKKVSIKDSAEFSRTIIDLKNGEKIFPFKEYYLNNVLKREGITSNKKQLILEGPVKSYFPKGQLKSEVNYIKGMATGINKFYYASGNVKKITKNIIYQDSTTKIKKAQELVVSLLDSAGNGLVVNGEGIYKDLNEENEIWEEGQIANGLRQGKWTGKGRELSFEEEYKDGILLKGVSKKGSYVYEYLLLEEQPLYKGGMEKFYNDFARNYNSPIAARDAKVNGRIILGFVVESDGSLTDIKIIANPGYGTAEEAVRVLKRLKPWQPGKQRGVPVRVSYTMPIKMNFG
ncbi:energy transducer TonB [Desertivirga brevis]|uniref:energy transducer TonB n=1 Tax=Desertivirga brevis TaxID=2810310 RepID=UPI001A960E72|nr:energy transducer TonB [Pedobacter sp. SYSU D00873]